MEELINIILDLHKSDCSNIENKLSNMNLYNRIIEVYINMNDKQKNIFNIILEKNDMLKIRFHKVYFNVCSKNNVTCEEIKLLLLEIVNLLTIIKNMGESNVYTKI